MFDLPMHPKVVHLPMGIALILPIVLILVLTFICRQTVSDKIWWIVVMLSATACFTSFVATKTGSNEWQYVEKIVPEKELEEHAEAGEGFRNAMTGVFALAFAAAVVKRRRAKRTLYWASLVASILSTVLAINAGHHGGKLVYKYGGAAAYTRSKAETSDH